MAGVANLDDMAKYGLAVKWAINVFSGEYAFDSTESLSKCPFIVAGECSWVPPSKSVRYNGPDSTLSNADGLSIPAYRFGRDGGLYGASNAISAKQFNQMVQYNNSSNPLILNSPLGEGLTWNGSKAKGTPYYTYSPVKVYLTQEGDSGITFSTGAGNRLVISPGQATSSQQQLQGDGLQYNFQFIPGSRSSGQITYSSSNTATYSTTAGTKTSNKNTQTATADITETASAEEGIEGLADAGMSVAVKEGWSGAWSKMKEIDFSSTGGTESTTKISMSVSVEPGTAAKNSDGTYIYTQEVKQPDGTTKTLTTGFVSALWYTASITKSTASIRNNIVGTYTIGGSVPTLIDSSPSKNSINLTAADALMFAKEEGYAWVNQYAADGFGTLNPDKLTVPFSGRAAGSTSVDDAFTIIFTENSAMNGGTPTSNVPSTASQRKMFKKSSNHIDLKDYDTTTIDNLGVSHRFDKNSTGKKSISGSGYPDIVYASKKGNHSFAKFSGSFLHGNAKNDLFVLSKRHRNNNIFAFDGNDTVRASSSQSVDLGKGSDDYIIHRNARKGSFHSIYTGDGEDRLIINSSNATFRISDFNPFLDIVKVGNKLKKELLSGELKPLSKGSRILDNAYIDFKYDGKHIGTAYLSSDHDFITEFIQPETHRDIEIFNAKKYESASSDLSASAFDLFERSVENGISYSKPIRKEDMEEFDSKKKSKIMHNYSQLNGNDISKKDWLDFFNMFSNSDQIISVPDMAG